MNASVNETGSEDAPAVIASEKAVKVLLMRPDERLTGGVVNYYNAISGKGSPGFKIEPFVVGRRPGLLGSKLLYPLQLLLDVCRLVYVVFTRSHDIYHLNPSLNKVAYRRDFVFFCVLMLLARGTSKIVFFRGWDEDYFAAIKANRFRLACLRWFCQRADRVLVLASSIRDDLIAIGLDAGKIALTNTTFDGSILQEIDVPAKTEPFTFLFMSRLLKQKGIAELLQAAVILRARGHDFKLVLAGSGPFESAARDEVAANNLSAIVEMPGYLSASAKGLALLSADVFVFPTYHGEGCPNCVLEAMGAGLPVISTRVGGIPDVLKPPMGGILLSDVAPDTIADAMQALMLDEPRRMTIADENRRVAWERYESSGVARYLESVYAELAVY